LAVVFWGELLSQERHDRGDRAAQDRPNQGVDEIITMIKDQDGKPAGRIRLERDAQAESWNNRW
jgi:hypothetical protein